MRVLPGTACARRVHVSRIPREMRLLHYWFLGSVNGWIFYRMEVVGVSDWTRCIRDFWMQGYAIESATKS
jgi:hypothetical protein